MGLDGFYSVEELEENLKKIKFALKIPKGNISRNKKFIDNNLIII